MHVFPTHHLHFNDVQPVFVGNVDLCQMGKAFFCEQQLAVLALFFPLIH